VRPATVLTVNAGSSSLKLRVVGPGDDLIAERELTAAHGRADPDALSAALAALGPVALRELTPLAPLHQPAALDALDAVTEALPGLPAVACLDTAFHATLPAPAATYALPESWRERHGLRRYGFHGLSHAYASRRASELLGRPLADLRMVTCHLGAGASLAAVQGGRSVDTTMGFTPVEGLVMATRPGNVDPGLLLWLLDQGGHHVAEVSEALEHGGGLRALAGTPDMRDVLARAGRDEPDAVLARDVYVHRLRALVAAMAAAMGGLDVLVFTGGVGERASAIRRRAAAGLAFLGVAVDEAADAAAEPDADVTGSGATVRTLVVRAREDLQMAREVRATLQVS
jgi:acetate kinase